MGKELTETEITVAQFGILVMTILSLLFFSYIITGTEYLVVIGTIFLVLYLVILAILFISSLLKS